MGDWDFAHRRDLRKPCRPCMKKRAAEGRQRHALARFRNRHAGKRGFILATGPSVKAQDIGWLRDEITVGINFIHKTTRPQGWAPTYMVTADPTVLARLKDEWETLDTNVILTDTCMVQTGYDAPNLQSGRGISLYYRDAMTWDAPTGFQIPRAHSTTGHLAIPWAIYLGLNPIYLIGCDCTGGGHCYDDKGVYCGHGEQLMRTSFMPAMEKVRAAAEAAGIVIQNATRGGLLEAFERVEFESLKP